VAASSATPLPPKGLLGWGVHADVVDLADRTAAQRPAGVARARPPSTELAALLQPGVEAPKQLSVRLACGQFTDRRPDVYVD
jgi:hypothetical protein